MLKVAHYSMGCKRINFRFYNKWYEEFQEWNPFKWSIRIFNQIWVIYWEDK